MSIHFIIESIRRKYNIKECGCELGAAPAGLPPMPKSSPLYQGALGPDELRPEPVREWGSDRENDALVLSMKKANPKNRIPGRPGYVPKNAPSPASLGANAETYAGGTKKSANPAPRAAAETEHSRRREAEEAEATRKASIPRPKSSKK